jgi:hypothetical protein
MPLSDTIKTLTRNAWDDGYPCLLIAERHRSAKKTHTGLSDSASSVPKGLPT